MSRLILRVAIERTVPRRLRWRKPWVWESIQPVAVYLTGPETSLLVDLQPGRRIEADGIVLTGFQLLPVIYRVPT